MRPRGSAVGVAVAIFAALLVLPWTIITMIETDSGWEDAVWRSAGVDRKSVV